MDTKFLGMPIKDWETETDMAFASDHDEERFWDKPVNIPTFHGTRSKQSLASIKTEGLINWTKASEGPDAIDQALKHFGKEKYLKGKSVISGLVRSLKSEIKDPGRQKIWITTNPDSTRWWSMSSPEIVHQTLLMVDVPNRDITKYLDSTYGKRVQIRLKVKPTTGQIMGNPAIIHSGLSRIQSKDIDCVRRPPEERVLDSYRGLGWIRLSRIPKRHREILNDLKEEYGNNSLEFWGLKFRTFGTRVNFRVD